MLRRLFFLFPDEPHAQRVVEANAGRSYENTTGENHPAWKGDSCGYSSIHDWVKRQTERPSECEDCSVPDRRILQSHGVEIGYLHLANISGKYLREITDWKYLCPRCHSKLDSGRNSIQEAFTQNNRTAK